MERTELMNSSKDMSIIIFSFTATGTELNRRLRENLKQNFRIERESNACIGYAPEKYSNSRHYHYRNGCFG